MVSLPATSSHPETACRDRRRRGRSAVVAAAAARANHSRAAAPEPAAAAAAGDVTGAPAGDPAATLGDVLAAAERAGGPNKGVWKRGRDAAGRARRAFVVGFLGPDRPVTGITRADLHRLVAHLEARPGKKPGTALSPKTVNRYLAAVSGILRFACLEGLLPGRPPVPLQSEDEGRIHWLTDAQEKLLCDCLASRGWRAESLAVAVLCASGLRWGEFQGLEPDEVLDWGTRTFKIAVERSKNRHARTVSIAPGLGRALRAMLLGGERPSYYAMRTRLAAAVMACGLDPAITIHTFRHTTATRLARLGKNPRLIMDFMGHRALATTMKYVHMSDDMHEAAALELAREPLCSLD